MTGLGFFEHSTWVSVVVYIYLYLFLSPHEFRYLFAHFKYIGTDFEADMAKMKEDPKTLEWWKLMDTFQVSQPSFSYVLL